MHTPDAPYPPATLTQLQCYAGVLAQLRAHCPAANDPQHASNGVRALDAWLTQQIHDLTPASRTIPTHAILAHTTRQIRHVLAEQTIPTHEPIRKEQLLAALLASYDHSPAELGHYTLDRTLDLYVGQKVMQQREAWLWLHDTLVSRGHTERHPYDFGYGDRYAYWVWNQPHRKAFVGITQNQNYLVLLARNSEHADWTIHLRRWWEPLRSHAGRWISQSFARGRRTTQPVTYRDIVKHAAEAERKFSDHLPGVTYIERPDLALYKKTQFQLNPQSPCPGLRYGDGRDAGYLISVKYSPFGFPEADHAISTLTPLKYVLYDLASLVDTFRDLTSTPAPTNKETR